MKTINGITYYSSPNLEVFPGLVHAFLGRTGGISSGHLASLNMGKREEDRPENLTENKKRVAKVFGTDVDKIFTVSQVHSDRIIVIDDPATSPDKIKDLEADGIITNIKGVALGILTADCVPVLFLDSRNKVIAAVHAGWKGTASKIASKTIKMMIERFESRPQEIRAAIGPAIGACCYEVGQEVVDAVGYRGNASAQREGKWYLDLPRANMLQLQEMGIADIDVSGICTSCKTDLFFSHRKEMGKTGRQLSFISHTPSPEPK